MHSAIHWNGIGIKSCILLLYVALYIKLHISWFDALIFVLTFSHVKYISCVNTCFAWKCTSLCFQPKCFACLCNCLPLYSLYFSFIQCYVTYPSCPSAFGNWFCWMAKRPSVCYGLFNMGREDKYCATKLFLAIIPKYSWCTEVGSVFCFLFFSQ